MRKDKGFTIVELAITVPIVVIVMAIVLGFLVTLLTDFSNQRTRQTLHVNGQLALQQMEVDTKLSSEFLTGVDVSVYNDTKGPDGSGGTWTHNGILAPYRAMILQTYATTKNPLDVTRSPVYLNQNGCTGDDLYLNDVLRNVTIYFVNNKTLYRRMIVDKNISTTNYLCASTPTFQVQSCPTGVARPSNCFADDVELLKNVTDFTITYYTTPATSTAIDAYDLSPANDAVLVNAVSADISITQQTNTGVKDTTSLRVTRIN